MRILPEINIHKLPEDVHSKLAQLELEYSEGDLTEKGYEKKRRLLLAPYVRAQSNGAAQQKSRRERDKGKRRLTRNESRYHSEIRTEAVQQALAEWNRSEANNAKENGQDRPDDSIIIRTNRRRRAGSTSALVAAAAAKGDCNGLSESKSVSKKLGGSDLAQKEKNGRPVVIGNKTDARPSISSPSKKQQNDLNNKQQQLSGPINKSIVPEPLNGGLSSSKPSTPKSDSRKALPSSGSPSKKATCTVSPVPTTSSTTAMSVETTIASVKPATKSGPPTESVKVELRINDLFCWNMLWSIAGTLEQHLDASKVSSKTTNGNSGDSASVRPSQISMRRGSHQQPSSSHHHQMPIKRTSVLVLEDRPLPELPPDASDLSDTNEEEVEDSELRRGRAPNVCGVAGGGTTDDAVYINTRTSTNDSGLGGSTRAPQEYANANFSLKPTRVSQKIQQLLLTLQRPKRRPIQEFYNDDDDAELEAMAKLVDPNAPKSTGSLITPVRGDFPPSASTATAQQQLPRSVDAILQRHGTAQPKGVAGVVLDCSGKPSATLTYGKLLTRATKIAHMLLSRQVTIVTSGVKEKVHLCLPGDRVALVYPNTEPLAFLAAFYGCLLAGVVPVPIEVPLTKRDAGIQQFGFLLGSCGVRVALTTEACLKGLPKVGSHQSTASSVSGVAGSPHSGVGSAAHHHHTFPSSTTGSGGSSGAASTSGATTGSGGGAPASGVNYYNHYAASTNPNDVADFKGWPRLHWTVTEHLSRPPKDWKPLSVVANDECAYIEHTADHDGTVKGVCVSRQAMLNHCRALTAVMGYREADTMVCVLDFKRDVGLWHAVLAAIYAGMRVHFIPYSLMKINPTAWLQQCTRQQATVALVKSRDLHWSLMTVARDVAAAATSKEPPLQLSALRAVIVADGANPWSLSSCDQFLAAFHAYGLHPEALCPCTGSPETGTVSIRRPPPLSRESERNGAENNVNGNALTAAGLSSASSSTTATQSRMGRGILSMLALSHSVVRVDQENSLTSLTLQDAGQVIAGGMTIVVKPSGHTVGAGSGGSGGTGTGAKLCKMDEVGEICLHAPSTASSYFGLRGVSQQHFAVTPLAPDNRPLGPAQYVRSGLIGFLGPNGLIFVIGNKTSMLAVSGRQHSADDLIATVLAVEPMRFVYRGRIAVFSVRVLRDERICIVAEQKPDVSEEDAFNWMYRVRQAVDSIHQVGVYCMALLMPNQLPKTPLGGIHVTETRRRFLDGCLYPTTVMMSPQSCVLNLPKPREPRSLDVGAAAMFVGNIVQGARIAGASGRELSIAADETINLIDILRQRAAQTPDHVLYALINAKGAEADSLSCQQLLKKAERIGALLLDKGRLSAGDHVALIFAPGLELISAFYGCLSVGLVPVCIRAPSASNLQASLITVRMVVDVSKSVALLSNSAMIKLLKSKEASSHRLNTKAWPTILDIDDAPSSSVARRQRNAAGVGASGGSVGSADRHSSMRNPTATCYLDFSVSTTGQLAGVVVTEYGAAMQCKSLKVACELYPSRNVTLCLDPYSGLGFALWCLSSIYSGHHSTLIAPADVEQNPANLLNIISQNKVRDAFCSYSVMEMCVRELAPQVQQLREKSVNLSCLRTWVAVAEERPRVQLCNAFIKLLAPLGLAARAVSTSFGARVNAAICMQGAASPDPSILYVDARALRNDRVSLVEKGAPHSIPLMESGKLLPGVKVVIANSDTGGQCADSHLGEIWVSSGHNAAGYFSLFGEEAHLHTDHFNARLNTGDTKTVFARTGYLGFLRQTQSITADGEFHDAVFVVGALDEALMLRGMRYHPADVETTVMRAHRRIIESAVFTWMHLLVAVAETDAPEAEAADLVPAITSAILEEHHLIVGVVLVVDPATIPINSRGEKQRMHLRDAFLKDQLDPIYVAYNE